MKFIIVVYSPYMDLRFFFLSLRPQEQVWLFFLFSLASFSNMILLRSLLHSEKHGDYNEKYFNNAD